ncbi:hypothetical protein EJ110_NYTH06475 [Nymphaea thermarum]|nr:hypothetical protein EJ110_NYTH06475 [Nymphaea thermarum]
MSMETFSKPMALSRDIVPHLLPSLLQTMNRYVLTWVVVVKLLCALWLKTNRIAKLLKKQGIDGPPYKLLFGNCREFVSIVVESLDHAILQHLSLEIKTFEA